MAEPLAVLLRLQRQTVDDVQRSLIRSVEEWDLAVAASKAIARLIASETETAIRTDDDAMVATFMTWLAHARNDLARAEAAESAAEAEVGRNKVSLAAVRASAEAIEAEVRRVETKKCQAAATRLQDALDDAGLWSHRERVIAGKAY